MREPTRETPDRQQAETRRLWRYGSMGTELAASIVGLTLAGVWTDHQFGCGPIGTLVGAGLGVVGGLYNFIRAAIRLNAAESKPGDMEQKPDLHDDHGAER